MRSEQIYQIKQKEMWGDYGSVLLHGLLTVGSMAGGQRADFSVQACLPLEPVIIPANYFVCNTEVRNAISDTAAIDFDHCDLSNSVNLDWRQFAKSGPIYPKSGEPEDYLREWPRATGNLPEYWVASLKVHPIIVPPDREEIMKAISQMREIPTVLNAFPSDEKLVYASAFPGRGPAAVFIRESLVEQIADEDWGRAIEFLPIDVRT